MQAKIERLERNDLDKPKADDLAGNGDLDQASDSDSNIEDVRSSSGNFVKTPRGRPKQKLLSKRRTPSPSTEPKQSRRKMKRQRSPTPDTGEEDASSNHSSNHSNTESDLSEHDTDFEDYDHPKTSFGSIVGLTVDDKIKKRILADKFVEMSELLPNFKSNKSDDYLTITKDKDHAPKFLKHRPKTDINFGQWCEAFSSHIAIYMEKAKTRNGIIKLTRSMLTYQRMITELKRKNYDWAAYDRHFRTDREKTKDSWATTRQDLLTTYQNGPLNSKQPFRPQRSHNEDNSNRNAQQIKTRDGNTIPAGYCMAFHTKGQRCEKKPCQYEHRCPKCKGRHPIFNPCYPRNSNPSSQQQSSHASQQEHPYPKNQSQSGGK